jgi:hypothetical protein
MNDCARDVRYWHKADIPEPQINVRNWGKADIVRASQNIRL